ncbi:DUF4185 domain-containing protein [Streptomyces rubellomurinus]|uniref:DUF4185 domain-containing protein n=1 Tax=Streptomyces rubellomurinus (strain ATCC 31215) TaxID=359131 RepID=A0A0F2TE78_STRR3|nr:DUF4185 domain-containing protein [Streptomyces rubellomurinus]KJS60072.1 hypothetical protein VM95_23525 [Streptomyces rubellomurinus]
MTHSPAGNDLTRRTVLKLGIGVAVGAGAFAAGAPAAIAGGPNDPTAPTIATKVKNLSGLAETGPFGAPWTDLGIPVRCPDGTMLFVCGDTFDGSGVGDGDWYAPVGLRSSSADPNNLRIDGVVGGDHARSLVDEPHTWVGDKRTTAIPSDAFVVNGVMYMHLMRGVIYDTHHTDFWRSTDNGETWEYLCQWPADLYGGQFQQKTYAVADDGYCYVLSTVFNRDVESGMLLHRVRQDSLGNPDAYEPWGFTDSGWQWNAPAPTTVFGTRKWGEICFRAMDGKYVLTWLNMDPLSIRAMVFPLPTSDLTRTLEQTMILPCAPGQEAGNLVLSPYGGFVVPGSTFGDFHIVVSQWYVPDPTIYRIMQYRIAMLS